MLTPDFIEVKQNKSLAERYGYTYDQVMNFLKGGQASKPVKEVKVEQAKKGVEQTTDNLDDLFGSDVIEGVE